MRDTLGFRKKKEKKKTFLEWTFGHDSAGPLKQITRSGVSPI